MCRRFGELTDPRLRTKSRGSLASTTQDEVLLDGAQTAQMASRLIPFDASRATPCPPCARRRTLLSGTQNKTEVLNQKSKRKPQTPLDFEDHMRTPMNNISFPSFFKLRKRSQSQNTCQSWKTSANQTPHPPDVIEQRTFHSASRNREKTFSVLVWQIQHRLYSVLGRQSEYTAFNRFSRLRPHNPHVERRTCCAETAKEMSTHAVY